MLVLTRKEEESIMIGDDIKVTVVQSSGGQVRIGIDAPKEVDIYREEIYEKIKAENKQASAVKVDSLNKVMKQLEKKNSNKS